MLALLAIDEGKQTAEGIVAEIEAERRRSMRVAAAIASSARYCRGSGGGVDCVSIVFVKR